MYQINDTTRLALNTLLAGDRMAFNSETPDEGGNDGGSSSQYLWLTVDNDWTDYFRSKNIVSVGYLDRKRQVIERSDPIAFLQDTRDTPFSGLRSDWTLDLSERQLLKWGVYAKKY